MVLEEKTSAMKGRFVPPLSSILGQEPKEFKKGTELKSPRVSCPGYIEPEASSIKRKRNKKGTPFIHVESQWDHPKKWHPGHIGPEERIYSSDEDEDLFKSPEPVDAAEQKQPAQPVDNTEQKPPAKKPNSTEFEWGSEWKNRPLRTYTREEFETMQGEPERPRTVDCTLMDRMDRAHRSDDSEKESDWEERTGIPFEPDEFQQYKMKNPCRYPSRYNDDFPCNLRQFIEKFQKCYSQEFTTKYKGDKREAAKMLVKTYPHLLLGDEAQDYDLFDYAVEQNLRIYRTNSEQRGLFSEAQGRYYDKKDKEEAEREAKEAKAKDKKKTEEEAIKASNF
jgi:hypothetical protein